MFVKNTSVTYFPIGKFINTTTGAEVTTGTPTGEYTKDGTEGTLSGTIAYKSTAKEWGITGLTSTEMNGATIGLNFELASCLPLHYTIKTVVLNVDTANAPANVAQWNGTNVATPATAGYPAVTIKSGTGTGEVSLSSGLVTAGTVSDKTGYALSGTQTFNVTGNITGNLSGSVGSVTAGVSLASLDSPILQSGTAQAGAGSTITLAAGASATDDLYKGCVVRIYGGTGAGQARAIIGYVGSTKVATVDRAWATNPSSSSTYAVEAADAPALTTGLSVSADIQTIKTQTVTCAAGVTVLASVGTASTDTAQTGDSYAVVNSATFGNAKLVRSTTPANTLDVSASGEAGIDWANVGSPTTTVALSGTTVGTVTTTATATAVTTVNGLAAGVITATSIASNAITAAKVATDAIGAAQLATDAVAEIQSGLVTADAGTAQAGAGSTITLAAGASATNSNYHDRVITITGGTGIGQSRIITGYVGGTKVATVHAAWTTTPDNTSTYSIGASTVSPSVIGAVGSVTGAVGSVTGAVGSVTGNVGGNVTGTVGSVVTKTGYSLASTQAFDNTGQTTNLPADLQTIKTQTITCAAGVTVLASVGTAATSTAQTGDSYTRIGSAGAGLTALGDTRIANLDAAVTSRLAPTTAGRTLDVSTTGEAGLDFDNIKDATGAHTLTNITVPAVTTTGTATAVTTVNGLASGVITATSIASNAITSAKIATDAIGAAQLATDAVAEIQSGLPAVLAGTAQAGAASTITLASGSSATNSIYNDRPVTITGGTGVGQSRIITGYVGATKVATVHAAWTTTPDNTSTYAIADSTVAPSVIGAVASVTGAVGSVTGAVGSVTGNVGGNVVGSVGSLVGHTVQTGDAYAIVNDSGFGNAKLVRSTTPANTLDVSSTGEAGLDFNNIKDATGAHTLTNITVPAVTTTATATAVTTVNGLAAGVITATSIASDAITDAKVASDVTIASVTGAVGSVTGNVGGNVTGSIGSLGATAKSDVNAEVLDVLNVDTFAEPSGVPAATSSLRAKIGWLVMLARNKLLTTATTITVRNDADSADAATTTHGTSSGTYTRDEWS